MASFIYSGSKSRLSAWTPFFSPKILDFVNGLNSNNSVFDKGEVARLGLGEKLFFCFGSWDGLRTLYQQAKLYCHARHIKPVITDNGERIVYDSSDTIYDNGISPSKSKTVSNAKAGESYHNWGCAIDLYLCDSSGRIDWSINYNRLYEQIGLVQWSKDCGLTWGGSWADNGHFQHSSGVTLPSSEFWTESNAKKGYQFLVARGLASAVASSPSVAFSSGGSKKWLLILGAVALAVFLFLGVKK